MSCEGSELQDMLDEDGNSVPGGEGSGVANDHDNGISNSRSLDPSPSNGTVRPMTVESVVTKLSPQMANPGAKSASMTNYRTGMMIDSDPASESGYGKKYYLWVTPGRGNLETPDDGSAKVIIDKMLHVLCTPSVAMLADAVDPRASVLIHVVLARHVS